jgi:hypothetical protein
MATDAVGAQPVTKTSDHTLPEDLPSWWAYLKRLYLFLLPLRFSFLALAVVGFAFLISDQGHDIIAAMTENDPRHVAVSTHPWQRLFFVPLVSFLAVQIWYWSRTLLRVWIPGMPSAGDFPRTTVFLPRALGVAAYGIMLAALYRVGREYGRGGGQPLSTLWSLAVWLAVAMVVFILFCVGRRRMLEKRGHSLMQQKPVQELAFSTKALLGSTVLISVVFFLSSCFAVQTTGRFGSMGIVLLSMALWVSFGSILVYFGTKAKMPILTILLCLGLLFSPLADNHTLLTLRGTSDLVTSRPTVGEAFDRWSARLAHDYPNEERHPVFVVATEGGGIRAAYWTAAVLTALDDGIPGFRDHLFAVSAVSGGSVGSATYAALVTRQMDSPGALKLRPVAQEMLAHDALAPTLSAMTQQDFVQRFIPYPFLPDRARALEGGWERAWQKVWREAGQEDDRFGRGFLAMLRGREDRMPSFFLNGTTVETGERMIGSNCRITTGEFRNALDVFTAAGSDLRVSTTAHNSARFTYVSPAGTFVHTAYTDGKNDQYTPYQCKVGARCEHVVDGGYLDNSGAITASEILQAIQSRLEARPPDAPQLDIDPYVIIISYTKDPPDPPASERWLNESLSPVRALLSTRGARADLAVSQIGPQTDAQVITFRLVQRKGTVPMPLGWLLSLHTRSAIDAQVGDDAPENREPMRQVAQALSSVVRPDMVQRSAAAAPAVKEMSQK